MNDHLPRCFVRILNVVGCALIALLCACGSCEENVEATQAVEAGPPNVVIFVVDTLRADHLSQYGYEKPTSVAIDSFVSQATRFTDASSVSGWTVPSVASLMTGLHPETHRTVHRGDEVASEHKTLTEALKEAGWETAGFSFNPNVRPSQGYEGFDHFVGGGKSATTYPNAGKMADSAIDWLSGHGEKPFFLYLQPMNCHGPYRVPADHREDLLGRAPAPGFSYYGRPMKRIMHKGDLEERGRITDDMLTSLREKYDTAIRYTMDQMVRVIDALRSKGEYDNSLIILTADHGEELFDHGGFSHGYSLHREVVQIPMFIKLPGQTEGRVVDSPVSLLDIYPTVARLLDLQEPETLAGIDLGGLLRGDGPGDSERVLVMHTSWRSRADARAIKRGDQKLIRTRRSYEKLRNVVQLYDLGSDPNEHEDLSSAHSESIAALLELLDGRLERYRGQRTVQPANRIDEMDLERLRALGYAE